MAKRNANKPRPNDPIIAYTKSFRGSWQAATTLHSRLPPSVPRRVARAHAKHTTSPAPSPTPRNPTPTLGDRFHALPTELRAHIFSLILVQPAKWDMLHQANCVLHPHSSFPSPVPPTTASEPWTCTACAPLWRCRGFEEHTGSTNPLRRKWAPEKMNPYLCDDCWDAEFRPEAHPLPVTSGPKLLCLCARRTGLETLLVCKQWYAEAGFVFCSQNTFGFRGCKEFISFISILTERWKTALSRVSIPLNSGHQTETEAAVDIRTNLARQRLDRETRKDVKTTWACLRQLPSLSYLELDAAFLSRVETVKAILRLGLRNTRQIRFVALGAVQSMPMDMYGGRYDHAAIWPYLHNRFLLTSGLPEEVARGIKGLGRRWMKKHAALERAVEKYVEVGADRCRCRQGASEAPKDGREIDLHDCEEWTRLWCETDGASHPAFQATRRYVDRGSFYWRH